MQAISNGSPDSWAESATKIRNERCKEAKKVGRALSGLDDTLSSSRTERVDREAGRDIKKFADISNAKSVPDTLVRVVIRNGGRELGVEEEDNKRCVTPGKFDHGLSIY
jgi:hypothetical protein